MKLVLHLLAQPVYDSRRLFLRYTSQPPGALLPGPDVDLISIHRTCKIEAQETLGQLVTQGKPQKQVNNTISIKNSVVRRYVFIAIFIGG